MNRPAPFPFRWTAPLALLALIALSACATVERYEAMLNTWNGQPERALVSSWGTPTRVYESGGVKWLTYVNTETTNVAGSAPSYKKNDKGEWVPIGGTQAHSYTTTCETTFEIEGGVVKRWRHKGDGCVME
jgi:hypothetical protein